MFGRKHNATRIQFSYSWPWAVVAGGTRGSPHVRTLTHLQETGQRSPRFGRSPASFIQRTMRMTGGDCHASSDLQKRTFVAAHRDHGATKRMTKTCPAMLAAKRGVNWSGRHALIA